MPTATTLRFPPGYGTARRTMSWGEVRARLEAAPAYWLSTARPDGRPHVVPLDGIWLDDVWWYGGSPDTVHIRTGTLSLWGDKGGPKKIRTLQRWRTEGLGPRFLKIGHTVRYTKAALDAYLASCERSSTSEAA